MSRPPDEDRPNPVTAIGSRVHQVDRQLDDLLDQLNRSQVTEGIDDDADVLGRLAEALPAPSRAMLAVLLLLSIGQLIIVLPWLVDADPFGLLGSSSASHMTRDGALGLAVATAGLLTAWRPRWALPCFVLASVAIIAQATAGLIDRSISDTGGTEFIHLPSIILTCLIGLSMIRLRDLGPNRRPPLRRVR